MKVSVEMFAISNKTMSKTYCKKYFMCYLILLNQFYYFFFFASHNSMFRTINLNSRLLKFRSNTHFILQN